MKPLIVEFAETARSKWSELAKKAIKTARITLKFLVIYITSFFAAIGHWLEFRKVDIESLSNLVGSCGIGKPLQCTILTCLLTSLMTVTLSKCFNWLFGIPYHVSFELLYAENIDDPSLSFVRQGEISN